MDIIDIKDLAIHGIKIVPFIIGLMQVAKVIVPTKYIQVVSLFTGVALGLTIIAPDNIAAGILIGGACGLAAVELYDTGEDFKNNDIEDPTDIDG